MALEQPVAIILIGFMFFLVYVASTLSTKNKNSEEMPINNYIKILLYALSGFTAFISIQLAVSYGLADTFVANVQRNIEILYWVVIWSGILLLILLVSGIMFNWLYSFYAMIKNTFRGRKWGK